MAIIRAFREDDIDAIAQLHQHVFPPDAGPTSRDAYRAYFRDTFLAGPHVDSGFGSLVCEDGDGALIGFLGVVPFRMRAGDRQIWATVCTQFCVDPRRRGMTGLRLIREHLGRGQDLSITDEANAITKRLWAWAGGEAVTSCSLRFVRPLRPAQAVLARAARRPLLGKVARGGALAARLVDRVLASVPQTHLRPRVPTTRSEPLEPELMAAVLPEITRDHRVVPHYDPDGLAWYLRRAEASGEVVRRLVRDRSREVLGWYIYQRAADGSGALLQLAATEASAPRVLDHLLHDAWEAGLTRLEGRLDPAFAQIFSDRHCHFTRRGPWMLVHAQDRDLVHAFHRGEALFSALDGEYCVRFRPPAS